MESGDKMKFSHVNGENLFEMCMEKEIIGSIFYFCMGDEQLRKLAWQSSSPDYLKKMI